MKTNDVRPKKLTAFFVATTLLPLLVVGLLLVIFMVRDLRRQNQQDEQQVLDQAQTITLHQLQIWKNVVRLAATAEPTDAFFDGLTVRFPEIQSILRLGTAGRSETLKKQFGVITTSEVPLDVVKARRLWQGPIQINHEGAPRVPMAAVIANANQPAQDVLVIDFSIDPLKKQLEAFRRDLRLREGHEEFLSVSPMAGREVVAERFAPEVGWTMTLRRPWVSMYAPAVRMTSQIFLSVLLIAGLAVVIGWKLSKKVAASIAHRERLSTIGEMAAVISHEMKTALAVMRNSVEYLKQRLTSQDPKLVRHLEIIESQVKTSNRILSDILVFSKDTPSGRDVVNLNELVSEVLDLHAGEPQKTVVRRFSDAPLFVSMDPLHLRQVVGNLVENAIHATEQRGEICVETQCVDNAVVISVSDTGCGIDAENLSKIFEPFFTTKSQGTGLGLSIVKKIVDQNKGHLDIQSDPGRGTVVTVRLAKHSPPQSNTALVPSVTDGKAVA